jgi:uncharacterized protein (DUF4415 family)/uncharacterized DUF497 family protein
MSRAVYEWDEAKNRSNQAKHGVLFAEAVIALEDERALTIPDEDSEDEQRFATIGVDGMGESACGGLHLERRQHSSHLGTEGNTPRTSGLRGLAMKREYDFSKAKRGAVVPADKGKTRITIRLDNDVLDWFREQVDKAGGGNYQTMINTALREYMKDQTEPIEKIVRRVVREELKRVSA